jgi:RNA polymerase sigma-70 factor (ECF subfamily)
MTDTSRVAEKAARDSYGRILAYLATRTHDIASAEDALADAFTKALTSWPRDGVPGNPDAWILTVARNRLMDRQRRQSRFPTEGDMPDMAMPEDSAAPLEDRRLSLLMVCAHPAIAPDLHTPLMLQTVLGIDAASIARLFLIPPAALAKRLVRAKAKIRDAGIPFHIPETSELPARSAAIREAIYALHALDWLDPADELGEEALFLADLLCRFMPDDPESLGLSALIAFSQSRRQARVVSGVLVPTEMQDVSRWDEVLIAYGDRQLRRAHGLSSIGRFQIQAAIEAVHLARRKTGLTDWLALSQLFHAHIKIAPSAGAAVSHAVVAASLHGAKHGLTALDHLEEQIGPGFQPYWAARAELLSRLGETEKAKTCYDRAISLTTDPPVIRFLRARCAELQRGLASKRED